MANNYSEMSIAFPVTEEQGAWLEAAWETMNTSEDPEPAVPPAGLHLEEDDRPPCELEIMAAVDEAEPQAWLYSEESVDPDVLASVLVQFLKHFDRDDGIGIEAALTCSKPRIGQFGGFAIWVTKDGIEAWSTSGWLAQKEKAHARNRVIASIRTEEPAVLLVTCDGCSATSESGWGDTPLCIDCQLKTDPSLVCEIHSLTHERDEPCPTCRAA